MKLSELKVGDKFMLNGLLCELLAARECDGKPQFSIWNKHGFDIVFADLDVSRFIEPQYKPYSDLRVLVGKPIKWKDDGEVRLVVQATDGTCWTINGDGDAVEYDRVEILEITTHLDGTPCGELIEE